MGSEGEALRLKTLAEENYNSSNLKTALKYATRAHRLSPTLDGLSETLTAFQILSSSAAAATSSPDWYKILQIDPFSHINIIKKQYKKLALTLHPDKNPFAACEEAFKLVAEGFRVLSDKTARKEYDLRLRMAMQQAATEGQGSGSPPSVDGFSTECLACRAVHQFHSKYLGQNLICPSCKKSFRALEVGERQEDILGTRASARIRTRGGGAMTSGKLGTKGGVLRSKRGEVMGVSREASAKSKLKRVRVGEEGITLAEMQKIAKRGVVGGVSDEALEKSKLKRAKIGEEGVTLSEMQLLAKKKVREEKMRLRVKEKVKEREKVREGKKSCASNGGKFEDSKQREVSDDGDLEIMEVEDSDFYDFDKDRVEKSFKKGQVWAVYDDDDGMPRHYSLIDEVSVYPFKVKLSWLELQIGADERLLSWEKTGARISCGRFKVTKTDIVDSVNIFSHFVNAERAAREVYRVYPRKGSVWALFNEDASQIKDKRCYDIVVCLTNYDEVYGLSTAYLEKVEGFKSVFKRREIGCHAVKSLEKDDFRLFSHQIPARNLTGEEAPDLLRDCWELDPASLPPELLKIRRHK